MRKNQIHQLLLIFLFLFSVTCFKINYDQKQYDNPHTSLKNNQYKEEGKYRFLQTVTLTDQQSSQQAKQRILNLLNEKRTQLTMPLIVIDTDAQLAIQGWNSRFKSFYTLPQYLSVLTRFNNSQILQFTLYSNEEQLLKSIQGVMEKWISNNRLKLIGIVVNKNETLYSVEILLRNVLNTKQINIQTYNNLAGPQQKQISQTNQTNQTNLTHLNNQTKQNNTPTPKAQNNNSNDSTINQAIQNKSLTNNQNLSLIPDNLSVSSNVIIKPLIQTSNQNKTFLSTLPPSNSVKLQKIANNLFPGIIIDHNIPTTFSNKQIFEIRGRLTTSVINQSGLSVNFILKNIKTNQRSAFSKRLAKGQTQFTIIINFNKLNQGQYTLSLFAGQSGISQTNVYKIISNNKSNNNNSQLIKISQIPKKSSFLFKDNKLFLNWDQNLNTALNKIIFSQRQLINEYILSNFQTSFQVPFKDFYNFNQGIVNVSILSAYSTSLSLYGQNTQFSLSSTLSFNAFQHHFSQIKENQIELTQEIPWIIKSGQTISIKGKSKNNLQNRIIIQQPLKSFKQYFFNEQDKQTSVTINTILNKQISFLQEGPHIIQVNNIAGQAVINRPVYVGDSFPLLPDFADLNSEYIDPQIIIKGQATSLVQQRTLLLKLINQKRDEFAVKPLISDNTLDNLAQTYAEDMVNRKFYGHINPQKLTPQQRATKAGINTSIGQNLAININLTQAHFRLSRSPAHLQNIVNPQWQSVGLGIKRDANQYFYVSQQFAGRDYTKNPLSSSELAVYKNQIVDLIKQKYSSVKSENVKLSTALNQWQNLSESAQNSISMTTFIKNKGLSGFSIGNIRIYFNTKIVQNLNQSKYLEPDKQNASQVGLSIKLDGQWLQIFVAYV